VNLHATDVRLRAAARIGGYAFRTAEGVQVKFHFENAGVAGLRHGSFGEGGKQRVRIGPAGVNRTIDK
jgi:hypothetical protein